MARRSRGSGSALQNSAPMERSRNRERSRQSQDAVAQILFAAASERGGAADVSDIVAAMIEEPEQPAEPTEALAPVTEASADLEHRSGVLAGDPTPVLDAERLSAQPPLHAFGDAQPLQQLRKEADGLDIVAQAEISIRDDIAGRHQRMKFTKLLVKRRATSAFIRAVHNIVYNQRYVMKKLNDDRGVQDSLGYRTGLYRSVARENAQRAEVL